MLECFAYYKHTPDGGLRWGTLITGGGDERVVGNAVLKNPGSAAPVQDLFSQREDGRMKFSVDATMFALAELFRLDECGGTVRLFNLFDVRDVDPDQALCRLDGESYMDADIADQIAALPGMPTYLGWGDLWKNPALTDRTRRIYETALPYSPYLAVPMENNPFFHPLYLMRYGRNRRDCNSVIQAFQELLISA